MKKLATASMAVCVQVLVLGTLALEAGTTRWVVYYSDEAPLSAFEPYNLLILDSDYHPPLGPLAQRGKTLIGYISVGEVESERAHFAEVQAESILLQENENWERSLSFPFRAVALGNPLPFINHAGHLYCHGTRPDALHPFAAKRQW